MDRTKDNGVGWRRYLRRELRDLDIRWLDPTRKPIDIGVEDDASRERRRVAKATGDYTAVGKEMYSIRRVDLRMVDISDWMPINIDIDVFACGTLEELFLGNREKKPLLIHVEQGKRRCPDWLFGVVPHQHIFGNWPDLVSYVRHVAHDDNVDCMKRWYFFNESIRVPGA
jgi:hypothetical protein